MNINDTRIAFERFCKKLESFTPLPEVNLLRFAKVLHKRQINKGEVLLREGQVCKQFYFIFKGCLRSFSLEHGKEINVNFYFEDDFAGDFESFRTEEPSRFYLIALEESIVYGGARAEVVPLLESDQSFYVFVFRFFQELYFKETQHSNTFKLLTPEERYKYLLTYHPNYLQRISVTYLASYLGISRETLTRIRKKVS